IQFLRQMKVVSQSQNQGKAGEGGQGQWSFFYLKSVQILYNHGVTSWVKNDSLLFATSVYHFPSTPRGDFVSPERLPIPLSDFLGNLGLLDFIRRLFIMFCKSDDSVKIGFLCSRRKSSQLHVADHLLSKCSHKMPPVIQRSSGCLALTSSQREAL